MDEKFRLKYKRVLDIIGDVAECAKKKLVLVGGTSLALFYLKHRISVDLDFVPVDGDEVKLKEELKGCITKKGYRTTRGVYQNQFIIQFEDTSIKIEIFSPEYKIKKTNEFEFGTSKILVASIEDILRLKVHSYAERKEVRDLYDIIFILKHKNKGFEQAKKLITKYGSPKNEDEIKKLITEEKNYKFFKEVMNNVS